MKTHAHNITVRVTYCLWLNGIIAWCATHALCESLACGMCLARAMNDATSRGALSIQHMARESTWMLTGLFFLCSSLGLSKLIYLIQKISKTFIKISKILKTYIFIIKYKINNCSI